MSHIDSHIMSWSRTMLQSTEGLYRSDADCVHGVACGTNCSYEVKFTAPAWECTPSEQLNPPEAPWATNYTCQSPWVGGTMCGNGMSSPNDSR